jgi:glyoxylase-like metal-dependent hydrolase (beta-lactamase superfamily II)
MKPLDIIKSVRLMGFRLPTSENVYVFLHGDGTTLIDTGYGIYYEDIKSLLASKGVDPSSVRRIFVTHCDADHCGSSGFFEEEFGTSVFMHPEGQDVIDSGNRACGTSGRLLNLNKYYSRLVNRFTGCRFPEKPVYFPTAVAGKEGQFNVIDHFWIGELEFHVLQSRGGHIPGVVFFFNREHGLLFTSDYLINVQSLSPRDKDNLGVYRYLLTNPNSDAIVYKQEVADLKEMIRRLDDEARASGKEVLIFPGHGEYYRACEIK